MASLLFLFSVFHINGVIYYVAIWDWFVWLTNDVFKVHFSYHFEILRFSEAHWPIGGIDGMIFVNKENWHVCHDSLSVTNDEECSLNSCYRYKEWCSGREWKRLMSWIMSWLSAYFSIYRVIIWDSVAPLPFLFVVSLLYNWFFCSLFCIT